MNLEQWTTVDHYINHLFEAPDPVLDSALNTSRAAGLPEINVAPNQGKLLQLLAQSCGAQSILEIGTLGGYSTIWLARALPPHGKLITLEFEPKHAEVARANFIRAGLNGKIELRLGKAAEHLAQLVADGRGPFDFIFIDADKESYPDYLAWALKLSRRGTVIIADNVVRQGAITDANSDDPRVRGARRFNELLAAEPRVCATILQTVGSKGYDGFALARVIA
ncbi:MAG: O-methyltransferase [Verrucomicrobiota bacterium]|jgi:predicted O-methyltransferase YrrM